MVKKAGGLVNIKLRPYDLERESGPWHANGYQIEKPACYDMMDKTNALDS